MTREPDREGGAGLRVALAIGGAAAAVSAGAALGQVTAPGADEPALMRLHDQPGSPASVEWLAPSIRVGRNELQIARFRDQRSPDELLARITSHWPQRGTPVQRSTDGGWLIAVQADGEWVETVRVRADDGGAAGLRIRQRLAPVPDESRRFVIEHLLPQARLVNRTEQDGGGRAITTWVLVSQSDPQLLMATARSEARRQGFAEDPAQARTGGPLWLRRRAEEVVIHATPGLEGSVAVVHWSRKP